MSLVALPHIELSLYNPAKPIGEGAKEEGDPPISIPLLVRGRVNASPFASCHSERVSRSPEQSEGEESGALRAGSGVAILVASEA